MAGITFINTVTRVPADWANTVNKTVFDVLGEPQNIEDVRVRLRLKTMSEQSNDDVRILGGYLDDVVLGGTTPVRSLVANRIQTAYAPAVNADVITLGYYVGDVANRLALALVTFSGSLGSMSNQNNSLVTVTGGTVDGVAIGSSVPVTGVFSALKVNTFPVSAQDVLNKGWFDATYGTLLSSLGTLSTQNSTNLQATGGALNGVTIGLATAAAGKFTTLTASATPVTSTDVANKLYVDTAVNNISLSVGTLGIQNANAIAVTGGVINGVSIGATSAASAKVTSLEVANTVTPTARVTALGGAITAGFVANNGTTNTASFLWNTAAHPTVLLRNTASLNSNGPLNLVSAATVVAEATAGLLKVTGALQATRVRIGALVDTYHGLAAVTPLLARGVNRLYEHTTASTATTILDFAAAHVWGIDLNVNTAVVFDNGTTTSTENFDQYIRLYFKQNGVAPRSVTWPISVRWVASAAPFPASAPDFTSGTVNGLHIVDLHSIDNGVTWIAHSVAGTNSI